MRRIYFTIAIFGLSFIGAQLLKIQRQRASSAFSLTVEASEKVELDPDIVEIQFDSQVDLASSPQDAKKFNTESVDRFLKQLKGEPTVSALSVSTSEFIGDWGVAQSFSAKRPITVLLSDIHKLPETIEQALNAGMNSVKLLKFSVSKPRLEKARAETKAKAYKTVQQKADMIASALGYQAVLFTKAMVNVPASDPVVSGGSAFGYGSGAGDTWDVENIESELETDIRSATVPISSFIKNISEVSLPEPAFKGKLTVTKLVAPAKILVTQSASLPFVFKK